MSLLDLAIELICRILGNCDITSVVSTGQTCKYLHAIAFDESVWREILEKLQRRSILDRRAPLHSLSTGEMIRMVQRLLTGPVTWSQPAVNDDDLPSAEVSEMTLLHPAESYGFDISKVLPSGLYVFFENHKAENHKALECWDVVKDRLIWRHTPSIYLEHAKVEDFAAEEIDAESAVVMICLSAWTPTDAGRKNFVEMVNVNFRTGTSSPLLYTQIFESSHLLFECAMICGDLAAVAIGVPDRQKFLIINWKEQLYLTLGTSNSGHVHRPEYPYFLLALVPKHVLALAPSPDGDPQIRLIKSDTIRACSEPCHVPFDPSKSSSRWVEDIPSLCTFQDQDISTQFPRQDFHHLQVYPSPVQDGVYRVWIFGGSEDQPTTPEQIPFVVSSYRLSIQAGTEPQWHVRSPDPVVQTKSYFLHVSYSGHVLGFDLSRREWTISRGWSTQKSLLGLFDEGHVYLAPYSGAVAMADFEDGVDREVLAIKYYS